MDTESKQNERVLLFVYKIVRKVLVLLMILFIILSATIEIFMRSKIGLPSETHPSGPMIRLKLNDMHRYP